MGNENFRAKKDDTAKPSAKTLKNVPSTTPSNKPSPPKKHFIKVDVRMPDGRVVKQGVDIRTLKRYCRHAQAQLPAVSMSSDPSEVVQYRLPENIGLVGRYPTDTAITTLMDFLDTKKEANDLPILTMTTLNVQDLELAVEIFSLALALKMPITLFPLQEEISATFHETPITVKELAACWELLNHSKHPLITNAVESLQTFWYKQQIPEDQNRDIEAYIFEDRFLERLFDAESKRQARARATEPAQAQK